MEYTKFSNDLKLRDFIVITFSIFFCDFLQLFNIKHSIEKYCNLNFKIQ